MISYVALSPRAVWKARDVDESKSGRRFQEFQTKKHTAGWCIADCKQVTCIEGGLKI